MHLSLLLNTVPLFLLLFGVQPLAGQAIRGTSSTTALPALRNSSSSLELGVAIVPQQSSKPYALILCFVPMLTVFGNALVILAVYRERSLQTATNFLIVSLAVSDFMVATCVMSFAIYFEWNSFVWDLGPTLCNLFIGADVACSTASILNLFSITLDRYMAISHPLAYTQYGTNNARAVLSICLVWGISITVGLPVFFGANNKEDSTELICEFNNAYFIIFSSLLSFFAPCAIMILLYTVIFRRLRQREKARSLRNLKKSKKAKNNNYLASGRLENEKISSALLTGARMARQVGNHFKTRADQMLMDTSLQTSSFPSASPSLSEEFYGSRMNGVVFSGLPPPPTLLGSSFSRLSFSSLQQHQQGLLKRSNTVPLNKSTFLAEKSPQMSSNNLSVAGLQKSELQLCNNSNVIDCEEACEERVKKEDIEPTQEVIEDISQMVKGAIQQGLSLAASPQPTKKWVSFGENLYPSFPFIDSLSIRSDSSFDNQVMFGSVAILETSMGLDEQMRIARIQRHSSCCCSQEKGNHHKAIGLKSLISMPVTQLDAEGVEKYVSLEETSSLNTSANHQPPILNGKIVHPSSSPPADPSPPNTFLNHTLASTKTRKTAIRMSRSNGNLRLVVNHQLSLPIYPSTLLARTLNHHYHQEVQSQSCTTSLGEADESTNNPTTITPTANNNHKLSSTETLPNLNWKGLGFCCCYQKVDNLLTAWNQSSKRSNDSSTTPCVTTIGGDKSPRFRSTRSTRSQPAMLKDTNNNNNSKEKSKRRTDSWQKAFRQCDEVWRRLTTSLGQSVMLKGSHGGSRRRHEPRPSRQLIKKASKQMKREHKATVTLAVVLGVFLVCWVPFFTFHLKNAICMLMEGQNCVHFLAMFLSTWLGYLNSSMNPLVYTLFDIRFRKAFRSIIYCRK